MTKQPIRVLIVEARYYADISDALLTGAQRVLKAEGVECDVITVPGALEIPGAVAMASSAGHHAGPTFDAYVALGCVIRGETYHFELVANESSAGITRVGLDLDIPIANAILTTEDLPQATVRQIEKGRDAARVAVEMALLKHRLQ